MKLLRRLFSFWSIFLWFMVLSLPSLAYIPPEIEFTAVFDYENVPVSGNQTVIVRLFNSGSLIYKEVLNDVYFDKGVAKIVIGGENSDLINSYFDDINMVVSISVMQHQLMFPINSVPYVIRSKESNKARRVDNEAIIKFLETERRVGVGTLTPELTFDVNGVVILHNKRATDVISNGVMYWDGNLNEFLTYRNGSWVSMSWIPDLEDRSKWTKNTANNSIYSPKNVGIGRAPNTEALMVSNNVRIDGNVTFTGNLNVNGQAKLTTNQGFNSSGEFQASPIEFLDSSNSWDANGNLSFSGILYGDGSDLTNLHHFDTYSFDGTHINTNSIGSQNIVDASIYPSHITLGAIGTNHVATNQVTTAYIDNFSIEAKHIQDRSIQTHHMRKNEISSTDIKLNTFNNEKYADDAILTSHIVDGQITSAKIMAKHILREHLLQGFITSDKINNGTLTGSHVPLNTIPLNNFSGKFAISSGGTNLESAQNYGVLYSNSSREYVIDPTVIAIKDSLLGIGGLPDNDALITVKKDANASFGIFGKAANHAAIQFRNTVASWDVKVTTNGSLNFVYRNAPMATFTTLGQFSIGTENASEVLTLAGPLALGASKSNVAGTIRYAAGQFSVYKTSWSPITSGQMAKREFQSNQLDHLISSSVIHAESSALIGQRMLIHDVRHSTVSGDSIHANFMSSSQANAVFSHLDHVADSQIELVRSSSQFGRKTDGSMIDSALHFTRSLTGDILKSHVFNATDSSLSIAKSRMFSIQDSRFQSTRTQAQFIDDSRIDSQRSSLAFISSSDLNLMNSQAQQLANVSGHLLHASVAHAQNTKVNVSRSMLNHINDATIFGDGLLVFGGDLHRINANNYIAVAGDAHQVSGHDAIGIGDQIHITHDQAILMNASNAPLSSDRPGQLKIQAEGGVHIQFSPEMGISMTDGGGWQHVSDERLKVSKSDVDPLEILNKVRQLPVQYWQYKSQADIQHIGPTAQDFHALFKYGNSDKVIHSIDSDGVLLASVKGLYSKLSHLNTMMTTDQKMYSIHSEKLDSIFKRIDGVQIKLSQLEGEYRFNSRLLDQFEKDYHAQESMLSYLKRFIRLSQWQHLISLFIDPLILALIFGFGFGVGLMAAFYKRYLEKTS